MDQTCLSYIVAVDWICIMGKTICQNGTHDQAGPCLIGSIFHLICCWCGFALLEHERCNDGNEQKSTAYDQWPKQVFAHVDMFLHILAPYFGQHDYCSDYSWYLVMFEGLLHHKFPPWFMRTSLRGKFRSVLLWVKRPVSLYTCFMGSASLFSDILKWKEGPTRINILLYNQIYSFE